MSTIPPRGQFQTYYQTIELFPPFNSIMFVISSIIGSREVMVQDETTIFTPPDLAARLKYG